MLFVFGIGIRSDGANTLSEMKNEVKAEDVEADAPENALAVPRSGKQRKTHTWLSLEINTEIHI